MHTKKKLTDSQKAVAREFCEFIYKVAVGSTFTLWNVQGALRFVNPGVPAEQKYCEHLRMATEEGWIEPVNGAPETYRRIRHAKQRRQKSAYMRGELQTLKDKLICTLEGGEWID